MNARYVLLIASRTTPIQLDEQLGFAPRAPPAWSVRQSGRARLLVPETTTVLDLGGHGWIIGDVFPRHGAPARIEALTETDPANPTGDDAQGLLTRFWGNYVAVFSRGEMWTVLRAPFGILPVLYIRSRDRTVLASDAQAMVDVSLLKPEIDWVEVARTHYHRDLPSTRTGLAKLSELLAGSELSLSPGGESVLRDRWSPWHFASPVRSPPSSEQLRRTVQNCVAALVSPFEHPLLGLSGGLDSSIIAACLGRSDKPFTALTMMNPGGGDERAYARPLAEFLGVPLTERPYALADVDLDTSTASHQPRPCGWIHEQAYRKAVHRAAAGSGAQVFVTGNGGDNVFYNSSSARVVLDRLYHCGPRRATMRSLRDVAMLTGASAWQVAWEAFRVHRARRRGYRWRAAPRLLHRDAIGAAQADPAAHPWLALSRQAMPGKAGHVAVLLRMQNHLDTFDRARDLPIVNPLAAQPVVEACLAVPSWESIRDGRDRMAARTAFVGDLPPMIIDRTSKGSPGGFALEVLEALLPAIRERLLDGELARHAILDRPSVEAALQGDAIRRGTDRPLLLALLDTEAWVRRWTAAEARPFTGEEVRRRLAPVHELAHLTVECR